MQLYTSRTQRKEEFTPREKQVSLYVCGITPYDTTHLGHAFTYTSFDILIRYFEWQDLQVRYAQNVTDIDDDILRRAKQVGSDWRSLGNEWTVHFIDDMLALNVRPPDEYPRATEVIPEIIEMDRELITRGVAYPSNGSVYFDVNAFEEFGQLSHIPREEMLSVANERGNVPDDPNKRDPLDFVLWQRKAEGEPAWPSPWGEGRPGWHIECSTMVNKFLGPSIDIHGGGGDLIFPHHECEIAQSVSATGIFPFSRVWMHIAMVRKDGEKMSKSLGNLAMMSDLLKEYTPDALRLYLVSYHYRASWEYNAAQLKAMAAMAQTWQDAVQGARPETTTRLESVREAFRQAMDDDLNTPGAVAVLDKLAKDVQAGNYRGEQQQAAQGTLRELAGILGMRLGSPVPERIAAGWQRHRAKFQS
jgi:L-cysteine:1D-myo-inositol 2-amino-2-deoxy-alpha-D-glucopyranoside ligase